MTTYATETEMFSNVFKKERALISSAMPSFQNIIDTFNALFLRSNKNNVIHPPLSLTEDFSLDAFREKEAFKSALNDLSGVLATQNLYGSVHIPDENKGRYSLSWYDYHGALNTVAYWTDTDEGLHSSYLNGEVLFSNEISLEEFFDICYPV